MKNGYKLAQLIAPTRIKGWWRHKTPVFLGVACTTGLVGNVPLHQLVLDLIGIVLVLIPIASYVSVINDITDEADDVAAGKVNTMVGQSSLYKKIWILLCLVAVIFSIFPLAISKVAVGLYLANWLVFSLYSIPPIRLKARGLPGVIADACGGQMLPTLWSSALVSASAPHSLPLPFIATLTTWSFALGLRGILAHQIKDIEADTRSGTNTLAVRWGVSRTERFVTYITFPVEVISLTVLFWHISSTLAVLISLLFISMEWLSLRRRKISMVIIVPRQKYRLWLNSYYFVCFPLCLFAVLGQRSLWALLLIPLFLLIFPGHWDGTIKPIVIWR